MGYQEEIEVVGAVPGSPKPFLGLLKLARNALLVNMSASDLGAFCTENEVELCPTEITIGDCEIEKVSANGEAGKAESILRAEENAPFESILFRIREDNPAFVERMLIQLEPLLAKHGMIYAFGNLQEEDELGNFIHNLDSICERNCLTRYAAVLGDSENRESDAITFIVVREGYDPVAHAMDCFKAGNPPAALEILKSVPRELLENDPQLKVKIACAKQVCLQGWGKTQKPVQQLYCFSHAQKEFYECVCLDPAHREAYIYHAEFWHRIGNDDMAARILRSFNHVYPDNLVQQQLQKYEAGPQPAEFRDEAPIRVNTDFPKSVLIISNEEPDFLMDVMYDALSTLLGPENIVEYPWKPSLHGKDSEMFENYPCAYNLPGEQVPIENLENELRNGRFDLILYADMFHLTGKDAVHRLLAAADGVPLAIVDTWDESSDTTRNNLNFLQRDKVDAIFKREMLACYDYGQETYPLPIAYPDNKVPHDVSWENRHGLFWAGHRMWGMRRIFIEWIEKKYNLDLNKTYTPEEYSKALLDAAIGLDCFGYGFGTVRFYELPAHGCMLLAQRPPTRIPHNFKDGQSVVFYDDLPDLDEKIEYYLSHPEEVERIARAGHDHLKNHHTGIKRAEQMLAWIEQRLRDTPG